MTRFEKLLNLVLPKQCILCERYGSYLCCDCWSEVPWVGLSSETNSLSGLGELDEFRPLFAYEGHMAYLVQQFKYERQLWIARAFVDMLVKYCDDLLAEVDVIVPVPLSQERLRYRGYNQTLVLANVLRDNCPRLQVLRHKLRRRHRENAQMELNRRARLKNLKDCFYISDPDSMLGRRVLILDDVKTTGATLNSCAQVIRKAGAVRVNAVSLAMVRSR